MSRFLKAGVGITSPDSLLPHGEAFLRNYLVGLAWQQATLGLPAIYAYMPDDFGRHAQLPVGLAPVSDIAKPKHSCLA